MQLLKLIGVTIGHLFKQLWLLPQTVAVGVRQWRGRAARNELEAERLDRIRNPSKYRGK
jgi:hypothetical protein